MNFGRQASAVREYICWLLESVPNTWVLQKKTGLLELHWLQLNPIHLDLPCQVGMLLHLRDQKET